MNPDALIAAARIVTARAHKWSPEYANEANTKRVLIEPLLRALGWDIEDLTVVVAEYKVYGGTFLDYALKTDAKPTLFVEAKQLGASLDDPKFVTQTINYANNEGAQWCVLTDGLRWRVFKANEAVAAERKLAFELDIADLLDNDTAEATAAQFALLTPDSVRDGDLARMGERIFVDNYVRDALATALAEPSTRMVNAVKEHLDTNLTPAQIRTALRRVTGPFLTALSDATTHPTGDQNSQQQSDIPTPLPPATTTPLAACDTPAAGIRLSLSRKGKVLAHAIHTHDRTVLLAGSTILKHLSPSSGPGVAAARAAMEQQGHLTHADEHTWTLDTNYPFASPSTAAGIVTGTAMNGQKEWKTSDGTPLGEHTT